MGDCRRFGVAALFFARQFPDRRLRVGDVAGGTRGLLQHALAELGFEAVTTIDPAAELRSQGRLQRVERQRFTAELAARLQLDVLIALHPDAATDHAIVCGLPGIVVPCCVLPNAVPVDRPIDESAWLRHLQRLAGERHQLTTRLPLRGQNLAMVLR